CPSSTTVEGSVQAALNAAAADAPGPNYIFIGAGTYNAAGTGFDYSTPGAPPVTIVGASAGQTTLSADSSSGFVLRVPTPGSSVSGVSIAIGAPMTAGLVLDRAQAQYVDVTGGGTLGSTDGVQLNDSATYTHGTVTMPPSAHAAISQGSGATGTVSYAHLNAP